uniref:non-specific serine/threonine protein kinase n=1 Tax=Leersia perrieri TaxID=77586 RepID=A0A0D9X5C2_9ORYZ
MRNRCSSGSGGHGWQQLLLVVVACSWVAGARAQARQAPRTDPVEDFTPTVRNGVPKKKGKAGVIAGIVIGALVLGSAALVGIFMLINKRRKAAQQQEELYNLAGRPNVFSNAELKLATENFMAALNAILGRWGKKAPSAWNISGEPCSGAAVDQTDIDNSQTINPGIKCDCSSNNSTVCHVTKLRVYSLNVVGPIPAELENLTHLANLNLQQNYLTGPVPSFIGKLAKMQYLGIGSNNFTGELPEELSNLTKLEQLYIDSSGFSGPLPLTLSKLKNLEKLWASDNDFTGKIPDYIGTLTKLEELRIGDIVNGSSSLAFVRNLTSLNILILRNCKISDNLGTVNFSKLAGLTLLDLSFNNITGQVPQSILNLDKLVYLILGNNILTGSLPDLKSSSLNNLYARFFIQPAHRKITIMGYPEQFAIYSTFRVKLPTARHSLFPRFSRIGSNRSMKGSDNTIYEVDPTNLGAASYYVTGQTRWGVSNVGMFNEAPSRNYVINSPQKFQNTVDSTLFETARMSPSSLRYYGLGLENGNYSVKLQFAEFAYPDSETWESTGRRIFDIYVQADVFAFGVVALETVAGRPNTNNSLEEDKIYLFEWAWGLYERDQAFGIVDPKLKEFNRKEVLRVICAALLCTQGSPHQRPPMSRVVAILTGDIEVTEVVTKPSYITEWQLRGGDSSYATSSYFSESTTGEFRKQREIAPLNSYPEMTGRIDEGSGGHQLVIVLLLLFACCCSWLIPAVHAQQLPATDPIEVAALKAILERWNKTTSPLWSMSDEPCRGVAVDGSTGLEGNPNNNPGIKCDCSSTVCHVTQLRVYALNVAGQIPAELQNLTYLTNLDLDQNYLSGPIPSFIGQLTALTELHVGFNPLSGPLPKELGNLKNLKLLGISLTNLTGELPEELGNLTKLERLYTDSAGLNGPFPSTFSKLKNLKLLRASDNNFTGKIPDFIGSLTNLEDLVLRNCRISGDLGAVDFSKLAKLSFLIQAVDFLWHRDLSFNNISGHVPQSILNLQMLQILFLGNNSLTGELPDGISSSLTNLDFSYNQLTGSFPSWATRKNLQLNLVANNFVLSTTNNSILPPGLNCLQQDTPCFHDYSFAVDCGGNRSIRGSDNTMYELDSANLGDSSYYVTSQTRWGVSNVGKLFQAPNDTRIVYSNEKINNTVDSELLQTARMSPSSLRYYGIGLENGNYTVLLQFAELGYPDSPTWKSLGRRVFDIYIQGDLKEKDFNIRKTAGGKSFTAVYKSYTTMVSKNFLEIHLFWAGKGTCCIPIQGYYGPLISAISVTPNFTPTVRNGVPKRKSKAGAIVGIVIGASVLGLAVLFGIFMVTKKRKRLAQQHEELYNLVGRPDVFSNAELKLATDNFSPQYILGEGGYGPVYKGKLPDGRVIAVKQLSPSSHQGKSQFVTEVATISSVQHRNLVKLHGCCIDSNTPLLVYECLENGSLDQALFGENGLKLDWPTRFEIILGIARGLTYLHEESSVRIVHRDIKASNVLLDADLAPKISDFGLARLYDEKKTHVSTGIAGTFGYLAPEYAMRRHLTEKVDVFAFGVVALETVAGRSNTNNSLEESKIYLLEWAWDLYEKEQALRIVDPRLESFNKDEVLRVIHVALLCTQGSPNQRPPMSKVMSVLTGDAEIVETVTKPTYITEWQYRDGNSSYATSSYCESSTSEFNKQKEIDPLTMSPTITGVSHEGRTTSWFMGIFATRRNEQQQQQDIVQFAINASSSKQVACFDNVSNMVFVAALNTILGRWGLRASPAWNISGEPCSGVAVDETDVDNNPNINPAIKCDCSFNARTVCHITKLKVYSLNVVGQIPEELQSLTYLNNLGISSNNFTGELPAELGNLEKLEQMYIISSGFSGPFPSTFSKLMNLRILWASDNDFTGKIPDYFGSLPNLQELRIGDILNGSSSLSFISNLTSLNVLILRNCKISDNLGTVNFSKLAGLTLLDLSFNSITGHVPQSILNLSKLGFLFLGNNSLSGSLPYEKSPSLNNLDFSYNNLSGSFPPWTIGNNLQLNLVANNFVLDSTNNSILPSGLNCLQQDTPCFRDYSFAVDCGSNRSTRGSDNTLYETDAQNIGAASYYVSDNARWGVSSVGRFNEAPNGSYVIYSSQQFLSAHNSELFQTARMSPSSLRYYGIGLENGNYTVELHFAEFAYPNSLTWHSIGRRVFDIYVQGDLKEKNFNIRKTAGGKSLTTVNKRYTAIVSKNFLEIHLFWSGKGTCCIPTQGYYGPMISALSVTPNFIPTVRNGVPKRKSKAGTIAGVVIGATFFALAALVGIFMLLKKRRRMAQQKEELYNLVGRPNVFSIAELKLATENFGSQNILGEGGYGPVYKGKLTDGRVIAVKQLSQSSQQGKGQFVTEVATISSVQHRNLVKLHGCCIDSNTPLLVYEYLENGSLDQAVFGNSRFNLGWSIRFEIILGIARGLSYLHEEATVRIVHRDIKASNILLDPDLTAKISDFGLAKLYDEKKSHVSTQVAGTFGYLAPEYAMRGHLTEKADVFAFGVVALETVAGRSNTDHSLMEDKTYLLEWAWGLYEREEALGIVDPRLEEIDEEEVLRVIRLSLLCTQGSPHQRPQMSKVVAMLTGDITVADVVTKPKYITEWQLRGRNNSHITTSYSGSTADELSAQRETVPLTPSLEITSEIDDGR